MLYLPALWYHRVSQKGITVAVNYWHDMQFDHKYVYYRFLQTLAAAFQEKGVLRPAEGAGTGARIGVGLVGKKETGMGDHDEADNNSAVR